MQRQTHIYELIESHPSIDKSPELDRNNYVKKTYHKRPIEVITTPLGDVGTASSNEVSPSLLLTETLGNSVDRTLTNMQPTPHERSRSPQNQSKQRQQSQLSPSNELQQFINQQERVRNASKSPPNQKDHFAMQVHQVKNQNISFEQQVGGSKQVRKPEIKSPHFTKKLLLTNNNGGSLYQLNSQPLFLQVGGNQMNNQKWISQSMHNQANLNQQQFMAEFAQRSGCSLSGIDESTHSSKETFLEPMLKAKGNPQINLKQNGQRKKQEKFEKNVNQKHTQRRHQKNENHQQKAMYSYVLEQGKLCADDAPIMISQPIINQNQQSKMKSSFYKQKQYFAQLSQRGKKQIEPQEQIQETKPTVVIDQNIEAGISVKTTSRQGTRLNSLKSEAQLSMGDLQQAKTPKSIVSARKQVGIEQPTAPLSQNKNQTAGIVLQENRIDLKSDQIEMNNKSIASAIKISSINICQATCEKPSRAQEILTEANPQIQGSSVTRENQPQKTHIVIYIESWLD